MSNRNPKIENVLERIRQCVSNGRYDLSNHAQGRMAERGVNLPEVLHVLKNGWHEKRKDQYDSNRNCWKYAIRSQTVDDRSIRVVVAINQATGVVVVTVVDLEQ